MVQWLRLPETERRAGDGLDAALVERLKTLERKRDESYQIFVGLNSPHGYGDILKSVA